MRIPAAAAVLALATLSACGGGGGATAPTPTTASLTLTVSPDPIAVRPCTGCGPLVGEMEAAATFTVRETAGVAGTVESIAVSLRRADGTTTGGEFTGAAVTQLAGTNRLGASGSLAIPAGVHFPPGPGVTPGVLTATVTVLDAGGHRVTATVTANVV